MTKKIISIVISAYNEEGNINELYKQLLQNTKEKDCRYKYEFVFVNDGSTDKTLGKIKALQHHDSDVRIVNLKRNFGHEIAMTAGMDHALGDAVILWMPICSILRFIFRKWWSCGQQERKLF